jgi:hypothetical protein
MATLPLNRAKPSAGPKEIRTFPEASTQSFEEGEFVYLVNGLVTVLADQGTTILGMAMHDASGTTNTDVAVMLANPTQTFRVSCGEGTPAAVADTDVAVKYAIRVANNRHYVDPSDTDSDSCVIRTFLFDAVDSGDINPEAIISILPAAFQGGATAA